MLPRRYPANSPHPYDIGQHSHQPARPPSPSLPMEEVVTTTSDTRAMGKHTGEVEDYAPNPAAHGHRGIQFPMPLLMPAAGQGVFELDPVPNAAAHGHRSYYQTNPLVHGRESDSRTPIHATRHIAFAPNPAVDASHKSIEHPMFVADHRVFGHAPNLPVLGGHKSIEQPMFVADHRVSGHTPNLPVLGGHKSDDRTSTPIHATGHSVFAPNPAPDASHKSIEQAMFVADHRVFGHTPNLPVLGGHKSIEQPMFVADHRVFGHTPNLPVLGGHKSDDRTSTPIHATGHSVFAPNPAPDASHKSIEQAMFVADHRVFGHALNPAALWHQSYQPPILPAGHSVFAPNPAVDAPHKSYEPPIPADHRVFDHAPNPAAHKTPMTATGHSVSETDPMTPVPDPLSELWDKVKDGPKGDRVDYRIDVLGANKTARPAGF
jgi:hypothetical protein